MDQESAIQVFLAKYKNPYILGILRSHIRTPEGRNKLAVSMIHPVKLAVSYLESTRKPLSAVEYPMQSRVDEYQRFIAAVPEDEQEVDPFPELETLVNKLSDLIEKRKSC